MRFRLASVLRARSAQEKAAKGAVMQARREAEEAAERVRRMDAAIDARPRPDSPNALAFAATLWARQAMAGELAVAVAMAAQAEDTIRERDGELTEAATRRRTVEKLGERHAEVQRLADEAVAQREADDLTSTRNRGENANL
jgi:flagellar export protein FliJ